MRTRMLLRMAQELINKIVLVVGCVTLIDRQVKFINLWNSSRMGDR